MWVGGMSDPYEEPENQEKMLETDKMDVEQSVNGVLDDMSQKRRFERKV